MQFEASTHINAPSATTFALYANVTGMRKTLPHALAGLKKAAEAAV